MDRDKAIRAAKLTAKQVSSHKAADRVAELLRQGRAKEVTNDLMDQADPQRLHHHYVSGNTGVDMPMDKESRMERAAQMGFDTKAYHGTNTSQEFSSLGKSVNSKRRESYLAPEEHKDFSNSFASSDQGRVFPLLANVTGFHNGRTEEGREALKDLAYEKNFQPELYANHLKGDPNTLRPVSWGDQNAIDKLNDAGYPGAVIEERPWMDSYAVFDPTKLRSQFARFDPRLSHLSHLSASTGGAMELARHATAVGRAGGQVSPSKYLPNVPRAVHADGGRVGYALGGRKNEKDDLWWHGSPSGDLRGGVYGLHLGTKESAIDALRARIGVPADGSMWDGTKEYGKTLLAGQNTLNKMGKYLVTGHNSFAPKEDYYPHQHPEGMPWVGNRVPVDPTWKPSLRPFKIVGKMNNDVYRPLTDRGANSAMKASLTKGNAKNGYYYRNDGEDEGSISAAVPNGSHLVPADISEDPDITKAEGGEVEKKRDFVRDNPGGEWLEGKKARAAQYPDDKFMIGATTGVIGGRSSMFLPTNVLKGIAGLNDEVRTSGVHKYDSLLSDAREGGFDPEQKGNKVVVAVNHYGQPYLLEGNTRVAVAHSMGIPKVKAEVRYWNGAENVDGPMHPEKVFGMASDNADIDKADGGRVSYGNGGKSLGLYSKAAQIIRNQPQAKGSVDQLLAMVSKTKGVKPAELTNAGRPAGDTMSKEELAKHFDDALPKVDVERIGGRDSNGFPQYEQYTLPGGENYREHLLHLSDEREPPKALHKVMGAFPRDFDSEEGARQYIRRLDTLRNTPGMEGIAESLTRYPAIYQRENGRSTNPNDFKSSHWGTPNVLAHVRMSDRDNGETLHVHEVQSDWGQEGRENGFYDPEKPFEVVNKKTKEVVSRHPDYSSMWDAYRTHPDSDNLTYGDVRDEKPPQGPYVGNTQQWTDLALKHIMMEAAKGGYKRVVFSPGEANADLYGQRKEVSKLEFLKSNDSGEAGILRGFAPNGYYSSQHDVESHADLPKLIGKENAANLLAQPPTPSPDKGEDRYTHTLQGPLQVGGHGMVDYYKNYVNQGAMKLLQQHDQSAKPESYDLPEGYKGFALPVTDTSRESILKNGFQAFQRGGEVHKATGGQVMGYVPMASLTVPKLAVARAPQYQQQQAPVGRFSDSLSSLMDTVEGFKKKPELEDVQNKVDPSSARNTLTTTSGQNAGYDPSGMSEAANAAYAKLVDAYGQPLTINSAHRDPDRNAKVGGADNSQHLHGNAIDVDVTGKSYDERVALANLAWDAGYRGIGFYDNSLHFDVGDPRGWGPSYSRDSIPDWAQPFTEERYGYATGGSINKAMLLTRGFTKDGKSAINALKLKGK